MFGIFEYFMLLVIGGGGAAAFSEYFVLEQTKNESNFMRH